MSYLALARKWRPRTFSQLVGQDHINKALINALDQQRLHHAYLFTGTRGVGKTSVARILAKSLNCEKRISSTPCLVCDACISIEQGRFVDLIEIDGASKTRVEDTRDLLDNVPYAPTSGRFKIYLIDEVHMLSQHSFNALLKTLEEPPEHVKFILATTDPQKLPVTVLSRCLQFNLKHLPAELISQHLQLILQDEKLDFEIAALDILAQAARGSMRDALSLLDQAITSCNQKVQASEVKLLLGYTQQDYAIQLIRALAAQSARELLHISQQIAMEGGNFHYVLDEFLNDLHQMAVYQNVGDQNALISPRAEIKTVAHQFSAEDIQLFYQIALKGREEIHLAPTLAVGFNMTFLRMLAFRPAPQIASAPLTVEDTPSDECSQEYQEALPDISLTPDTEFTQWIQDKADEKPRTQKTQENSEKITPDVTDTLSHLSHPTPVEESTPKTHDWATIIPHLNLTGLALTAVENAELISKEGRNLVLGVSKGHQSLFTPAILARVETALSTYYRSPIRIILNSEQTVQSSPAQQKKQLTQQKQQKAETALQHDPMFQQLQRDFSAEMIKNSIVSLKDDL